MKCEIIIDKENEEKVLIYAHEKNKLVCAIEQLALEDDFELIGYLDNEIVKLNLSDINCFIVESNKIFALSDDKNYQLKVRLYMLEQRLPKSFIKINQSCIANIKKIKKFDASFSGSLTVIFQNGHRDYVSRRNLKNVKERLGL